MKTDCQWDREFIAELVTRHNCRDIVTMFEGKHVFLRRGKCRVAKNYRVPTAQLCHKDRQAYTLVPRRYQLKRQIKIQTLFLLNI